ncbi:MAG TPA: hypothetical protein VIR78_03765 [Malonomonas sp.]
MLQERLNKMKAASAARVTPEVLAIMQRTTAKLGSSGILKKLIKVGGQCPDFSLADENGQQIQLQTLRQQGPVLINIYRGVW